MDKNEFVKHIIYNNIEIDIGIDDYGQTYFIEYIDNNGKVHQECVGAYVTDYMNYIEYRFGTPEKNCPIYSIVRTSDTECCGVADKGFCTNCRKFYTDITYEHIEKRRKQLEEVLKEKYDNNNIT